jgi:secondary thiamine-phosphate synthase enzyme
VKVIFISWDKIGKKLIETIAPSSRKLGSFIWKDLRGRWDMRSYFKKVDVTTDQNNLLQLEPRLADHVQDLDFFHVTDLTEQCSEWVNDSRIQNGTLTVQALHTTCVISINELDEPCLLGDLNVQLREAVPKNKPYLHNSKIRYKNLCAEDKKCDRNGDAHIKAFMYGVPSQTLIVRDGRLMFGRWQRLCLIDFDGPRKRQVAVQVVGE